jgi:hypothetical protein
LSKANLDTHVRDNLNYLKTNIALESAVELSIAAGAVTKTYSHHTIDTQADAASDDLDTINGGTEGEIIFVRPASGSRTIVVKHNTGNIWNPSGSDVTLDDVDDCIILGYNGSMWCLFNSFTPEAVPETDPIFSASEAAEFVAGDKAKLDAIEDGADITDATNVEAAGSVMEGDTSTANMDFVVDEDDLSSNLATKVPTQQSVKAYIDNLVTGFATETIGWVIIFISSATGLYYEADDHDVRIRTSVAIAGDNVLIPNGWSWKDDQLLICH